MADIEKANLNMICVDASEHSQRAVDCKLQTFQLFSFVNQIESKNIMSL